MQDKLEQLKELCSNRLVIMLIGIIFLFIILVVRLINLQIIHGQEYSSSVTASISKSLNIEAPRGNIYDRYGRPLAINHVAYSIQLDNSISSDFGDSRHNLIVQIANYLWDSGATPTDSLPISQDYKFEFDGNTVEERNIAREKWLNDMEIPSNMLNATAIDILSYLYEKHEVPTNYTESQKRAFLSLDLNLSNNNILALTLAIKFIEFGETLIDDLPLEKEYPYSFHYTNKNREIEFKQSMRMEDEQLEYDSLQTLTYLGDFFGLPEGLPTDILRSAIGIRYGIYLQFYQQYQLVTLATEINTKTLSYFEENQDIFLNITVNPISLRDYPEGKYFSHILGYIRKMTTEDYALYREDIDVNGNYIYTQNDIVGQAGFEKLYERELNGTDGKIFIEVDNLGRRMSIIEETEPIAGKDMFLTLDANLQKVAYDTLEEELAKAISTKLKSSGSSRISLIDLFTSMVNSNNISAKKIMALTESKTDSKSAEIYNMFLSETQVLQALNAESENSEGEDSEAENIETEHTETEDIEVEDTEEIFKTYLLDKIATGKISSKDCILLAIEHGSIIATTEDYDDVSSGKVGNLDFILKKLDNGDLIPSNTGLDPSTGSVFVTKVGSGETLVSVSYPSYDNNELVNVFNNSYYNDLLANTNTPLVNRPLSQKKAPGSTFKMIPLLAGLETGVINTNTQFQDRGVFTDAGSPHARCWIYGGGSGRTHGMVDVVRCLEVSCNYFMYQMAYNMGNSKDGKTTETITTLNEYMAGFGLNNVSGLELFEQSPTMASPYYKERIILTANPDATASQLRWTDGDTIRAVIGQSVNSYTPAQMTKYISTLANGGTLYKLHMLDSIKNADGSLYMEVDEVIENVIEFNDTNLNAIYSGMYQVSKGSSGTLRSHFSSYPVNIGAKTGTAQESLDRSPHTWLVCFAPFEDPQIAITVMIPFGDGSGYIAPTVVKSIINEYFGLDYEGEFIDFETVLNQ